MSTYCFEDGHQHHVHVHVHVHVHTYCFEDGHQHHVTDKGSTDRSPTRQRVREWRVLLRLEWEGRGGRVLLRVEWEGRGGMGVRGDGW